MQRTKLAYRGFRLSSKTKTIDDLLNNLRCSISDLHDLRIQRTELIEHHAKQQPPPGQAENAASTDSFSAVLDIQNTAERVYEAVASVANCRCHKYYFQLRSELQTGKPPPFALSWSPEPLLCLFLSEDSVKSTSSTTECTCIAVRIESHLAQPPITNLCASLKAAAASQSVSLCIGLLPHQTHQHLLYKEPLKPAVTRISLPDVFELAQRGRQTCRFFQWYVGIDWLSFLLLRCSILDRRQRPGSAKTGEATTSFSFKSSQYRITAISSISPI